MRFSIASTALCGAVAVSALAVPAQKRAARLVDPSPFEKHKFELLPPPPQAQQAAAAKNSSTFPGQPSANAVGSGACPQRIEWHNADDGTKTNFVRAIRCLMDRPSAGGFPGSQNRWEDLVSVHQQQTPNIHMSGAFLPWHRYYLAIFQSLLIEECAYNGPMLWWDETRDAGNFANANLFTDQWFGAAPLRTSDGQATCIDNGAFAGITLHLGPDQGFSDHCLSRAVDESLTAQCNQGFVDYCHQYGDYPTMESCAEQGPHAYGHNGVGSVMSDVAPSPSDPLFFMHHGFVDRNWAIWQRADEANRLYAIGGPVSPNDGNQVTLDFQLQSNGIRNPVSVRDMMDFEAGSKPGGGFLCYDYDY